MNIPPEQSDKEKTLDLGQALLFIPGEYCFVERIEVPKEVSEKDLRPFIELALEGSSPFSLEQLYWGYWYNKDCSCALVYAAPADRFSLDTRNAFFEKNVMYVMPSFIGLYGKVFDEARIAFVKGGETLSAVYFDAGNPIPKRVESIKWEGDIIQGLRKLRGMLDNTNGYIVDGEAYEIIKVGVNSEQEVEIELFRRNEEVEEINKVVFDPTESFLWEGDLRPKTVVEESRKKYRLGRWLFKGMVGAIIGFGLLIVIEGLGLLGKAYLASKQTQAKKQEVIVKNIEAESSLAEKIEQLSSKHYMPVKLLEMMNENRPSKIYFTKVTLGDTNDVAVDGIAGSVDELNGYADTLGATEGIDAVDVGEIVSKQGKVQFKMNVKFKPMEEEA